MSYNSPMGLYEDFKKYRDKYGLNGLNTDGTDGSSTQNGSLFTMEYLICLLADPNTPDNIKQNEIARIRQVFLTLETFPGVSSRVPNGKEFDSMDNTGALAAFSGLLDDSNYSKRSYRHGEETRATGPDLSQRAEDNKKYYKIAWWLSGLRAPRFFWNNNNPELFCLPGWHGRSPGHMAFLRLTTGKWIYPWHVLAILIGQFYGCKENASDTDARKLPYINWQYLKTKNLFWKLSYKVWCYILMKQYPEGMKSVYEIYYRDLDHPIRKYSQKFIP